MDEAFTGIGMMVLTAHITIIKPYSCNICVMWYLSPIAALYTGLFELNYLSYLYLSVLSFSVCAFSLCFCHVCLLCLPSAAGVLVPHTGVEDARTHASDANASFYLSEKSQCASVCVCLCLLLCVSERAGGLWCFDQWPRQRGLSVCACVCVCH